MDFRKLASMAGKAIGDEVNKKANEMEKATRRDLSRRTDSEIRRAYDNRYDKAESSRYISRGLRTVGAEQYHSEESNRATGYFAQ